MKIVHLFSIYLFSSTPYPITGYLIFKDNSLFLRSTILLSIISIEVNSREEILFPSVKGSTNGWGPKIVLETTLGKGREKILAS